MIFIQIKKEAIVQVGDRTRINIEDTFISPDESAITIMEIEAETGAGFIDVTEKKYLDWAYSTEGDKTVTVRITAGSVESSTAVISCLSVDSDRLFSTDDDIISFENDVYRLLRKGRNSFLDFHRIAQTIIIDDLDQRGITKSDGSKIEKTDIWSIKEVSEWSRYLALSLIMKSVQSENDDVYKEKSDAYRVMADKQSTRAFLRLDLNGDDVADTTVNMISGIMVRR